MAIEKRLIDANALGIGKAKREAFDNPAYADGWNNAISIIENAPTLDVVEVVHGRWIWTITGKEDYEQYYRCSKCNDHMYSKYNYCPNCGAKMDGDEK